MIPQLNSVLRGWTKPSQMRLVTKSASDFELLETVDAVVWFDVFLSPMSAQKVERKPENLRMWNFWDAYTTQDLPLDTVIQDFKGTQYRVQAKYNWDQAGFFHYDLAEQPPQGPATPAAPESQQ